MPDIEVADQEKWDDDMAFPDTPNESSFYRVAQEEIESKRDALFRTGSDFKRTEREEIVGIDNVLLEIDPVIDWLRHSAYYRLHNARLEPGLIFEGEPGTGKTLVSRFIASASDALFINVREFAIAGQLFRADDISDLFARARQAHEARNYEPVVLFWDEFEAAGIERGGASPEQAMTTTQLLAELDGIHGKNEGVLLIGCTNYLYGIDIALRRPGRMGLHIEFTSPDREGKKLLLNYYLDAYPCEGLIDIDTLSYFFDSGAVAADIEEAAVEAWRLAVRRAREEGRMPVINQAHLVTVFLKRLVGPPTAFVNLPLEDRARIALHEAGHAIMALVFDIPLRLITVQAGKKSLGRCITSEVREHVGTMDEWVSQMRVGIGSILAEEIGGVSPLVGSTGDIHAVNEIATKLVDNLYGGDNSGLFKPKAVAGIRSSRNHNVSPNISVGRIDQSDRDVGYLLERTYADAHYVMAMIGKEALLRIAEAVNTSVTLTGVEFRDLFVEVTGKTPQSFLPQTHV